MRGECLSWQKASEGVRLELIAVAAQGGGDGIRYRKDKTDITQHSL